MFRREREQLRRLILVPYRPFRNLSLGIGGVILIIVAAVGGLYAGSRYQNGVVGVTPEQVQQLRDTVHKYEQQSQAVRDDVAVAQHDREIVRGAADQMRLENKDLLEKISSLQDQVALYKRLLSPRTAATAGLAADRLDLHRTATPGHVTYRLLLTQANSSAANMTGVLEVKMMGGGRSIILPVGDNRFSFQYFQSIKGEWQIPPDFHPDSVEVVLRPSKGATVQKSFRWDLQD
jgi:hypothetical protein